MHSVRCGTRTARTACGCFVIALSFTPVFVAQEQYTELSTWVNPAAYIYGAGERASNVTYMTRNGYPYTLWNRDAGPAQTMRNSYGHWPFVMVVEPGEHDSPLPLFRLFLQQAAAQGRVALGSPPLQPPARHTQRPPSR